MDLSEEQANCAVNFALIANCNGHHDVLTRLNISGFGVRDVPVDNIEDWEWQEGEVLGGTLLGWNFGDGHLNGEQLLRAIQPICEFEEGDVRLISVESQPLFGPTMHWRVYCPVRGKVAEGKTKMADYEDHAPWPEGEVAEAIMGGAARTH